MKLVLLLALSLCVAGVAALPSAQAGPVCVGVQFYCQGLVCVMTNAARVCVGGAQNCDPGPCPPDS